MQDIAKALCLFFVGLVMLITFGDAFFKEDRRPKAASASETRPRPDGPREEEALAERPDTPVPAGAYAQACSAYDPVAHPEQVLDILELASSKSCLDVPELGEKVCTPVDVIDAIWRNETGEVDGGGAASGRCDVMRQLEIRCKVGGSCEHLSAMKTMGARFGWDLEHMTCSCGTATMDDNTHYFGGCCGPFQFSGAEVVNKAVSMDLDPMTFCGGAVIAAVELRDHYIRFRKEGTDSANAWRRSISRYFGADSEGKYWAHARANWQRFHLWYDQGPEVLRAKLTAQAASSAKYHLKLRASDPSYVASY